MFSDDDRREVAARLRAVPVLTLAGFNDDGIRREWEMVPLKKLSDAVGMDYDGINDTEGHLNVLSHLADLIEPEPERTCRMVSAFDTDELENIQESISFSPEDTLAYRCEGCGFDFRYERGLYPSYCPNCGAKVVC